MMFVEIKINYLRVLVSLPDMDVFNKLKSTVTSTVNQISSVLPGNPVTREYDITGHIGSAGQGMLFKLT